MDVLPIESAYKGPCILRLKTISANSDIEDIAKTKFLAEEGADYTIPATFDTIPDVFIRLEDWPRSTNLRCWQCDLAFNTRPIFVPRYVKEDSGHIEFGVLGNMCSFGCAELYLLLNTRSERRWRAQDNLKLLYFIFTGYRIVKITPAPHKTEMQRYGGKLTDDCFASRIKEINAQTTITVAPMSEELRGCAIYNILRVKKPIPTLTSAWNIGEDFNFDDLFL